MKELSNNNLPKGWRKVKLGEILKEPPQYGYTASATNKKVGPKFLRVTDIVGYEVDWARVPFCKISEKEKKKYLLNKGDIVFARAGTVGYTFFVKENPPEDTIFASYLIRIKIDEKRYDPVYVSYFFKSPLYWGQVNNFLTGTSQPGINATSLKDFELLIPQDINEQKRIADILSAFDDKIELNNKIIKTLEEMAQEIFKEWFVRFQFPGWQKVKFVDSELGKIPDGWEVKNIMEIVKRIPVGKRYDNKTALPKGKVPILDQGQSGIIGFHNEEPGVKASPKNPVAVFSNHTCYYRLVTFDFSCIQNVIPYIGINGYPTTFVFYLTKDKIKMSDYKGHWPEFTAQKFIIPPPELAVKFSETIQPMIEKIDEIRKENQTLAELRDSLLPKLMSGEIRV
jgi:type I restriction enzyme S subunit